MEGSQIRWRAGHLAQPRGLFLAWAGGRAVPGPSDPSPHDSFPWAGRLVLWGICLRPELGGERNHTSCGPAVCWSQVFLILWPHFHWWEDQGKG